MTGIGGVLPETPLMSSLMNAHPSNCLLLKRRSRLHKYYPAADLLQMSIPIW